MGSLSDSQYFRAQSVAIIGAGPSGLAAAKYLLAERAFSHIAIFEQRSNVGGLWNYTRLSSNPTESPIQRDIPQTNPHAGHERPIFKSNSGEGALSEERGDEAQFVSPLYDRLETNIPRGLMGFSDLDWPAGVQLFPTHRETLQYIEHYAEDVRHLIRFRTQVSDVRQDKDRRWTVKYSPVRECNDEDRPASTETFDAVCVASGHFVVPYIPAVPGIESFSKAHPGLVSHSKLYRRPEEYTGKKVIIVGNSASGIDIGNQIATVARHPVIYSQKSESFLVPDPSPARQDKPAITQFVSEGRCVRFADGSEEAGVDAVLYCTGYFYSFPFLASLQDSEEPLITTGEFVHNLFHHLFYRPSPTLAFVTLPQKIIPFPIGEAQASVMAGVWSGRLSLPSGGDMRQWEEDLLRNVRQEAREKGKEDSWSRNVHVLKFPEDADYINMLHDWATSADAQVPMNKSAANGALVNDTAISSWTGKKPPYWGEEQYWARERFPAIKKAFASYGGERHTRKTLEDVGFSFQRWKEEELEEGN